MLKIPAKTFAPAVTAVVNQRMIRKLCEKCKEAYTPPAETLKQLGRAGGTSRSALSSAVAPAARREGPAAVRGMSGRGI